jgi:adenosine deaminase
MNTLKLPKVHVHAHLDGSYPRAAVLRLAARRGVEFEFPESFADVWDFFDHYGRVPALVDDLADLAILCEELVAAAAAENVVFFEPAIEPQLYAPRLGSIDHVASTMVTALQEAAARHDLQVGANVTINTDQDAAVAEEIARAAIRWAGGGVTAIGTAGFREPADYGPYLPAVRAAADAGLQVVAHAGQVEGSESIFAALDEIGATRISHGVLAAGHPDVLARLAEGQIVCDVCPVSNVRLGVSASIREHQVAALVAAGVPVTLNADDSLWFDSGVSDQYTLVAAHLEWDAHAIANVARNGSLLPALTNDRRLQLLTGIDNWERGTGELFHSDSVK